MNTIKHWFISIKNSFYNPSFYAEGTKKSVVDAGVFLGTVALAWAVIVVLTIAIPLLPKLSEFSKTDYVVKYVPADFNVAVKGGQATSTLVQPYFVPIKADDKTASSSYENVFVMDLRPDVSMDTINGYKSFAVLTKGTLIVNDTSKNEVRSYPLSGMKDLSVTREDLSHWYEKLLGILSVLALPIVLLTIVFIAVFVILWNLFASLVGALLVWVIAAVSNNKLTYADSYKVALYASAPVIIVGGLLYLIGLHGFPYATDLLFFGILVWWNIKGRPTQSGSLAQ